MGLESATYISDLVATNPLGTDLKSQGDDHIRLIKSAIKATFPNVSGAVTATHGELNRAIELQGKNKIINGEFNIWQRATSQTTNAIGSDDRWTNAHNGSTKTASRQTFTLGQTDVPDNPRYYARTVVTSSAGAANYCAKYQKIEGVKTLAGKSAVLTFYAKADASKNMAVEFYQDFGTGGSPSSAVSGIGVTTCALTASWQKFTVPVSVTSISGKTLGSNGNDNLRVYFWFDAGSDYNARTSSLGQQSGTFDIAQVQLEVGSVASKFEKLPPAHELILCQRYYESGTIRMRSYAAASAAAGYRVNFNTPKRTNATITLGTFSYINASGATAEADETTTGVGVYATVTALGTFVFVGTYAADAEL